MNKVELRKLIMDIGYLFNKHTDGKDIKISELMDDLNKMDSYKPLQEVIKERKELKQRFGIILDLMGYDKELDNTTLGHLFQDIALLKSKKPKPEEYD